MPSREITVLIADDEVPARKRLKTLLAEHPDFRIVAEAENGDQVVTEIIGKAPDAAFLDINMPGASVFATIPSLKNPPLIVFQTAYSEYGVQAFDVSALDYLMKPVSRERFDRALEKIRESLHQTRVAEPAPPASPSKEVLSIKSGETIRIIRIAEISRISFEEGFSFIHAGGEALYSDRSLNSYEELLAEKGFYRISRTDLVNVSCISKLHPLFKGQYMVEMKNGDRLTVSRRRIQGLKERIG